MSAMLTLVPEPDGWDDDAGVDFTAENFDFTPVVAARPGASDRFVAALERSRRVARRALSDRTLDTYTWHWRQFVAWCRTTGEDPLPADGAVVAAHITDLAAGSLDLFEDLELDADGQVRREPLSASTIDLRIAAINKAHQLCGHAKPGADAFCAAVAKSLRKDLPTRPVAKDPLTVDLLRPVLERLVTPYETLREQAMLILARHRGVGATDLARLDWTQVGIEAGAVTLALGSGTRNAAAVRRRVLSATGIPGTCPVAAMEALAALGRHGPVFRRNQQSTVPLTDQGVTKAVRRTVAAAGLPAPATGLPRLDDAALARATAAAAAQSPAQVRDRSLLLSGFASAVRRSNLAAFWWSDFTERDEGLVALLRRSKTDQAGRGLEVFLPRGTNELTCPVAAWAAWRWVVAEAIGDDPVQVAGKVPVYVRVGAQGGTVPGRVGDLVGLADATVNDIVKARAAAAGLVGNFGAHSLRAGFVTTLADAGVSAEDIAEQTHHRSLDVLRAYIRRLDVARRSPARQLGL
jgi:integrase